MKRALTIIIILGVLITGFTVAVQATDGMGEYISPATTVEVTEQAVEPDTEHTYTVPTPQAIESGVIGVVDEIDKTMSGVEMWEIAKDWILNNLSTVVGAILATFTLIMGMVTKFSFVPKVITAFKSLFTAVGEWYKDNIKALEQLKRILDEFMAKVGAAVDKVEKQSQENVDLRRELNELRREHIKVVKEYKGLTSALLAATRLQNEQLEDVFQISPLTEYDKRGHTKEFDRKNKIIDALIARDPNIAAAVTAGDDTEGGDGA